VGVQTTISDNPAVSDGPEGWDPARRSWWFDETAHAGREHLDADYVAVFDQKSHRNWSREIAALRALGIDHESIVVDLGAGTGSFARALAPQVRRVVAVDPSPAMVTHMAKSGVEAVRAGFLTYEHVGDPPDAAFSCNALHHLPDYWKVIALKRIAGLLRPGGVFLLEDLVYSFDPSDADRMLNAWLSSAPVDPAEGWTAIELGHHVQQEHSTFSWLLEPMLEHAGFNIRDRWFSDNAMFAVYTCTAQGPR